MHNLRAHTTFATTCKLCASAKFSAHLRLWGCSCCARCSCRSEREDYRRAPAGAAHATPRHDA
eukprot:5834876-Alexandrium_andersonii.AAC.1